MSLWQPNDELNNVSPSSWRSLRCRSLQCYFRERKTRTKWTAIRAREWKL